jgi:MHS family proline/betaine transporter-like MFS transporter
MSKRKSILIAAFSGNILEYYDFTVYAVFSVAISKTFFPGVEGWLQTLYTLAVFAVGFVTRPLGGIVFGYIGDKMGRRVSLITSMLGMTVSTFTIGLTPGYDQIGFYSPLILVMMRLTQGFCISGEGAGAAIFILEHEQKLRPGLTSALVHSSGIAGTFFASLIGIKLSKFFPGLEFAWRFAFILGGFMGLMGFYFRLRVSETPIFKMLAEKKKNLKSPFYECIKTSWRSMIITACLGGAASSVVYLVKSYIVIFHCNVLHFDDLTARLYLAYSATIMMLIMPISGYLSDRIGRLKMIRLATISVLILAIPCMMLISCEENWKQLTALAILAMMGGTIAGSAYIFIISLFKPEYRFTGVSFSYNLGIAMFGGTSAMISTWLVNATGLYYAPAYYIIFTCSIFLVMTYIMNKHIRSTLNAHMK